MARYAALDVMRGFTIASMILVNTPGDWNHVYQPLLHSHWHGLTVTDLVFPFFLFIIGSAMFFAFKKVDYCFSANSFNHIVKRSVTIFLIGLFLNAFPFLVDLDNLRIMGVLQRIALCYFFASLSILLLSANQLRVFIVIILCAYALVISFFGYSLEDNIVKWVDLSLLGENHMYALHGSVFDPEGVLSSIPAIASMLIGFEVTKILYQNENVKEGIKKLLWISCVFLALGYLLALEIPINKSLWTSSFVLIGSGFACLFLVLCVLVCDIFQFKKITYPFLVYGLNPLFIYVVAWLWESCYKLIEIELNNHLILKLGAFIQWNLVQYISPISASLLYAVSHVILFWFLSLWLYKKHIVIKI